MDDQSAVRFFHVWDTYARVVAGNYMFHRELGAAVRAILAARFSKRLFAVLDLGCGDAATFAPLLDGLAVGSYTGADLSEAALALARENLSHLSCPVDLGCVDMMDALIKAPVHDAIYASFALHHLETGAKEAFFRHVGARLTPGGVFLLVDVCREEGETLPDYLNAYTAWVRIAMTGLSQPEHEAICAHIIENDRPETASTFDRFAEQAGLRRVGSATPHKWHRLLAFERLDAE